MAGTQASIPRARSVSRRAARVPGSPGNRWPLAPPRTPACGARIARARASVASAAGAASPTSTSDGDRLAEPELLEHVRGPGDPAGLGGRMDLPGPDGAPPGDRHRRGRPQAVPLPPEWREHRDARSSSGCCGSGELPRLRRRLVKGSRRRRLDRDARARRRGASARRRRLPGRQRGVRRAGRRPRAGHAQQEPRHRRTTTRSSSTTRPRPASAPSGDRRSAVLRASIRALHRRRAAVARPAGL